MATVKVTTKWKITELVNRFVDNSTANALGATVRDEAKRMISEGQSPVKGYGRFERYKDRAKYPGGQKDATPVNLYLSGDMMDAYDYKLSGRQEGVEVGVVRGSSEVKERAGYHQEGTENMAQRRMVPGEGEEWATSIMRRIAEIWSKRLADLIRQSNKKT